MISSWLNILKVTMAALLHAVCSRHHELFLKFRNPRFIVLLTIQLQHSAVPSRPYVRACTSLCTLHPFTFFLFIVQSQYICGNMPICTSNFVFFVQALFAVAYNAISQFPVFLHFERILVRELRHYEVQCSQKRLH